MFSQSDLEARKNARWCKGKMWFYQLPENVYLNYIFVDKGLDFTITGGDQNRSAIYFDTKKSNVYNQLSTKLDDLGFDVNEIEQLFLTPDPRTYAFEICNPTFSQIKTFIAEIETIAPLPTQIKEEINNYLQTLSEEKKEDNNKTDTVNSEENIKKASDDLHLQLQDIQKQLNQLQLESNKIKNTIDEAFSIFGKINSPAKVTAKNKPAENNALEQEADLRISNNLYKKI